MKPIYQTRFAGPDAPVAEQGNCFAACLASILECSLEEVDVLFDESGSEYWLDVFQKRLSDRGFPYKMLMMAPTNWTVHHLRGVPYIAGGPSPRGDWLHSCVYLNGELLHDPVRDGGGLVNGEVRDIVVLVWMGT